MAGNQRAHSPRDRGFTPRRALTRCLAGFTSVLLACAAHAGEEGLKAWLSLVVSEEYNDNLYLGTKDRVEGYSTMTVPSLRLAYGSPRVKGDLNYALDYRSYGRRSPGHETAHRAELASRAELIDTLFFLELRDSYRRTSLDTARDYTQESLFINQSDRNIFTVNPYFVLGPLGHSTLAVGYKYVNTWYKEPVAIKSYDNIGYADVTTGLSSKATVTTGVSYTEKMSRTVGNNFEKAYEETTLHARANYRYAEQGYLYCGAGQHWFHFDGDYDENQVSWDVGISHRYSTMTATFETGLTYMPDPLRLLIREDRYIGSVRKDTPRTSLAVSGGLREYRSAISKHLENTSYPLNGTFSHAITPRTKLLLTLNVNRLIDYRSDTEQTLYLEGARLEHRALESLTLALDYRYVNSYSPDVYFLNYYSNRIALEAAMKF